MDINIDSQIVIQTAAQWAADTDVYSEKRILVTSDVYYTGTDQRKFKLANGVDTWSNLDYMPLGGSTTWGGITGTLSNQTDLQNALNAKENSITAGTTGQYWRGDKTFQTLDKTAVGLGNVDNTSDANKPISTATQTALDNKQDLDSDLTSIAGLTPSNDDIIQRKAGSWVNRTLAQLWVDLKDLTVTLTNKTLAVGSNSITGTASRVAQFGAGGSLEASSVTTTQLSYVDFTSSGQTQLDNRSTLLAKNNIQTTHTGTISETLILSYDLTSLLALNDLLKTNFRIYPNSTANNKTVRIKVNSSASLVGASTIGTYTFTSSCFNFKRSLWFENSLASIKSMYPTSSIANDETVSSNILGLNSITFDFTGPVFILITAQLTVSTDTLYFLNGEIIRKR